MTNEYTWEIAPCQEGAGFTLLEKESGQLMHSAVGPWVEANQVYVGQSEFDRRSVSPLVIYDVGLGIAANSLAAIEALAESSGRTVEIYSFERHPKALEQALHSPERFEFLRPHVDKLNILLGSGVWSSAEVSWRLLAGDFRAVDLSALPAADLVYFDFYAPAVCPELWTYGVFKKLHSKMRVSPASLLITYASNKAVRAAMLLAGFAVGVGVSTSMKAETTVASPVSEGVRRPLPGTWLEGFERSPKQLPIDWPEERRDEALLRIRRAVTGR